ncbi:esterase-like activity of phytase family protein [Erythrobacter sp. NFXS35]|uniref:esterase-like activity of phytase family protein n=1 Tax=Erythrobacter sp. NFXS35 TaxID=2818436 RepID=UPI0032DFCE9B
MFRWLLLALVIVGLAPGTFVRTRTGLRSDVAVVTVTPVSERGGVTGALTLTGAWELRSTHGWFGGFSALVGDGAKGLIAGSDRGWLLDLDLTGAAPRPVPASFRFVGIRTSARKEVVDLESLARDSATGTLWAAFENANLVMRADPDGSRTIRRPPEMAGWSRNSGPEAMVRLNDGRFLILAEGSQGGGPEDRPGLLFAGDPVASAAPLAFRLVSGADYDPVDATQLPDGRVLILLRRVEYAIPARFDTAIMVADPAAIRAGEAWQGEIIQRLSGAMFGDNFEGIAFVPAPGDPARGAVWLIADDNFSVFQRSLLVTFDWEG